MSEPGSTADGGVDALGTEESGPSGLSRRRFLTQAGSTVGGLSLTALLAACGSSGTTTSGTGTTATNASGTPKRGGTLTVGSIGSTSDTLDPNQTASNMDLQRLFNLYDNLTYFPHDATTVQYGLAESIELTNGSTIATVRLRDGVTFHNGKTLSADDLIFTLRRILAPSDKHAGLLSSIDEPTIKKLDNRTVRMNLKFPDSIFASRFYADQMAIVPEGFDPAKPVGTGPFMYQSFTPGSRSVFVRNPNYWVSGQPYLDQLVIIDLADPTAQINALLSGQVDAIDSVPLNQTQQIKSNSNLRLLEADGGYFQPIDMRVDMPPWNDVRVRQAMRLLVNRQQMIEQAYNGFATLGNDMPSPSDPAYLHLPQREPDVEQAKSLLKAAGQAGATFTMTTANEDYGLIPSAEVLVQNAQAAGITIKLNAIPPASFDPKFLSWPFTQGYWGNKPFGLAYQLFYTPQGIFNETHFNDPEGNAIFAAALKDSDATTRNEKFQQLMRILYERGGQIIHSFRTTVDAYNEKVNGLTPDKATGWSLGQYRYREVWMA
jgi:peptide/nickel transport system substrate-binding protein